MDWEINIKYGGKSHLLDAEIVYHSSQIMRIKVLGNKGYLLLENDYPLLQFQNSKKAIKWKVKELTFDSSNVQDAKLIADIIHALEYYVKGKNTETSNVDYIKNKKSY